MLKEGSTSSEFSHLCSLRASMVSESKINHRGMESTEMELREGKVTSLTESSVAAQRSLEHCFARGPDFEAYLRGDTR